MVELAVSAVSALVSPVIGQVIGRAFDVIGKGNELGSELEAEIKRLKANLALIQDVLEDAESKQVRSSGVKTWLCELKDVVGDAEDLLDAYATDVAIQQTFGGFRRRIKAKHARIGMASKIKHINKRLVDFVSDIGSLGLQKLGGFKKIRRPETTPFLDGDSPVIAREDDKNKVIELLVADTTNSANKKLLVLPIIGIGGIGKTTIARLVFNDNDRVQRYFGLKIWICVSDDFDLEILTRKIINYIKADEKKEEQADSTMHGLQRLHENLAKQVEGKKFLLILDDAWNVDSNMWEELLKPLKSGKRGSRVVVTTRNSNVVHAINGHMDPFEVKGLKENEIWEVVESRAFTGNIEVSDYKELEKIGKEIVKKLKGSPLAAKTIGKLLSRSLEVSHWRKILSSELWALEQDKHDILPSLMLSYEYLPTTLKQCFSFCSLFPKDYVFDDSGIIELWMAHDFFQGETMKGLEETGMLLIIELMSWSFFQREEKKEVTMESVASWQYKRSEFKMHDLVHDVAILASKEDHLLLTDGAPTEHPKRLRHLSLRGPNLDINTLKVPCNHMKLRTLICKKVININASVLSEWLRRLKYLRVLVLSNCRIETLPDSVGDLKHLRYLDLSYNVKLRKLPESLTTLLNLQVLRLNGCYKLRELPSGMGKLVNLRHLESFVVGKRKGHRIDELENLKFLRGELWIENLQNVTSQAEAEKARLHQKGQLRNLMLQWDTEASYSPIAHEEVLEAFRPNSDLETLYIRGYKGIKQPSWLNDQFALHHLEHIELEYCDNLQTLPHLGHLRFLRVLRLSSFRNLKRVGGDIYRSGEAVILPALQFLKITNMPEWEEWEDVEEGKYLFPRLKHLKITDCPKLKAMPAVPLTLEILVVKRVGFVALPHLGHLRFLRELRLSSFLNLKRVGRDIYRSREAEILPALQVLNITDMPEWEEWEDVEEGKYLFPRLKHLDIFDCPKLKAMPAVPLTLESLVVISVGFMALPRLRRGCERRNMAAQNLGSSSSSSATAQEALSSQFPSVQLPEIAAESLSTDVEALTSLQRLELCGSPSLSGYCEREAANALFKTLQRLACNCGRSDTYLEKRSDSTWEMSTKASKVDSASGFWTWEFLLQTLAQTGVSSCIPELKIHGCEATHLDGELKELFPILTSLKKLEISSCGEWLPLMDMSALSSLQELVLGFDEKLEFLPDMKGLSSLQKLSIGYCNLQSLPDMKNISSLQELYLTDCPGLQSLPDRGLPDSLQVLEIRSCPALEERYGRRERSPGWHTVSHIPKVEIRYPLQRKQQSSHNFSQWKTVDDMKRISEMEGSVV